MILGIGIDVIEIPRIRESFDRHGERFRDRVYTAAETEYCKSQATPALHYAARFAAKEAFSKSLGLGIAQGMAWREIGVVNDSRGAPRLVLTGHAAQLAAERGVWSTHVSLSHTDAVAVAVVILEGERPEDSPLPPA